jgi:hypothetical protein
MQANQIQRGNWYVVKQDIGGRHSPARWRYTYRPMYLVDKKQDGILLFSYDKLVNAESHEAWIKAIYNRTQTKHKVKTFYYECVQNRRRRLTCRLARREEVSGNQDLHPLPPMLVR